MSRARTLRQIVVRTGVVWVAVGVAGLLVTGQFALGSAALAAAPSSRPPGATATSFVDLGSAVQFSVLAGAGVSNTGAATVLALDLGLSPAGVIAGFPPGVVSGTKHDKDTAADTAQADRQTAYDALVARTGGTAFAGDQAGVTFTPGLYTSAAAITNTGTMTLDAGGDPSAVFVFQIGAALGLAALSKVVLTGGALANNVFWQVLGAVSLGAGAKAVGTVLASGAIAFGAGASLKGRALTPSTVALADSPVTQPIDDLTPPVVTIDGGATGATNDATPAITGTTDEPAGRPVTVTVAGQTLTATVGAGGVWGVGTTVLDEGAHTVVASSTDASQNTGTTSQVLTVDLTVPVVTIDGGAVRASHDPASVVSGTTDAPAATPVTVTVGGQTLGTAVGANGAWAVAPAPLTEAPHLVVASVADAAQNVGTATQVLVVDLTAPVIAIDGGPARSTTDTSPWTYGTTAEQAGSTVQVSVGGQSLAATVQPGGTWGVSAAALADGTYTVVAMITDAAQNTGIATQTLSVTGVAPGGPGGPGAGTGSPVFRPDAEIRRRTGSFVGGRVYDAPQRVAMVLRGHHRAAAFEIRLTNRGDTTDRLQVHGRSGNQTFKVAYMAGGQDVTSEILDGSYRTGALQAGDTVKLHVKVTRLRASRPGSKRAFAVRVGSVHDRSSRDAVSAQVRVAG